jgi:hypothetical protein
LCADFDGRFDCLLRTADNSPFEEPVCPHNLRYGNNAGSWCVAGGLLLAARRQIFKGAGTPREIKRNLFSIRNAKSTKKIEKLGCRVCYLMEERERSALRHRYQMYHRQGPGSFYDSPNRRYYDFEEDDSDEDLRRATFDEIMDRNGSPHLCQPRHIQQAYCVVIDMRNRSVACHVPLPRTFCPTPRAAPRARA